MAVLRSEIGFREVGCGEISQSELESATETLKNASVTEKSRKFRSLSDEILYERLQNNARAIARGHFHVGMPVFGDGRPG